MRVVDAVQFPAVECGRAGARVKFGDREGSKNVGIGVTVSVAVVVTWGGFVGGELVLVLVLVLAVVVVGGGGYGQVAATARY